MTEKKKRQNKDKVSKDTEGWGITDFIFGLKEEIPFKLSDIAKLSNHPRMDVRESSDGFIVVADVPGIDKEEIELEADENTLTLSGIRKEEDAEEDKVRLRKEIRYGSFKRSFTFPLPVDPSGARAKCSKGVLSVVLPKKELKEKKTLKVEDE